MQERIEKFHILLQNQWNFDEKGFLVGISRKCKRVVTLAQLLAKQLLGASQDGNREFITLIPAINVLKLHIPPALIYQSDSGTLMSTWLDDYDDQDLTAYFGTSEKGWSNDNMGIYWLQYVFDRHTKPMAGLHRRLLIVDGHNSHVNMRFINYCDQSRIVLAILPPHSTHRLQPLDVSVFGPLSDYYSQEINRFIANAQGLVSISKRHF